MNPEGPQRSHAGWCPGRGDLFREASTMVLYVSVIEIAELCLRATSATGRLPVRSVRSYSPSCGEPPSD